MELGSFESLIADLRKKSSSRDPRLVRLSFVTAAIVDVINNEGLEVNALQVYTKAVVTLEGTLQKKFSDMEQFLDSVQTQMSILQVLHLVLPLLEKSTVSATFVPVGRAIRNLIDLIGSTSLATPDTNLRDKTDCIATLLTNAAKTASTLIKCISYPPITVDEKVLCVFFRDTLLALLKGGRQRVCKAARYSIGNLLSMDNPKCHACVLEDVNALVTSSLELIASCKDPAKRCMEMTWALDLVRTNCMFLDSSVGQNMLQVLVSLVNQHTIASQDFVLQSNDSSSVVLAMNSVLSAVKNLLDCEVDEERVKDFSSRVMVALLQVEPSHILCTANHETSSACCDLLAEAILACARRLIVADAAKAAALLPLSIRRLFTLANNPSKSKTENPVASTWFFQLSQICRVHLAAMKTKDSVAHAKCCEASFRVALQVVGSKELWVYQGALTCLAELILQIEPRVEIVRSTVKAMISCRDTAGTLSACAAAMEDAIYRIIHGLGIEQFWQLIDFPRLCTEKKYANCSWLLKLMKRAGPPMGAGCTSLLFFQCEILPLSLELEAVAKERTDINEQLQNLVELWSLLPCFCVRPNDITVALPKISPILVRAMQDKRHPQLLISISSAIGVLAQSVYAKVADAKPLECLETDDSQSDVKTMEQFSEYMLPNLFNLVDDLFCAPSAEIQLMNVGDNNVGEEMRSTQADALANAITSLAKLASKEVLRNRLFTKVVQRLLEASQAPEDLSHKMCSLLALSQALYTSGCLGNLSVVLLYRTLRPLVGTDDTKPRVQKRAYKLLAELCKSKTFITGEGRLRELVDLLTLSTSASQIASRSMRLRCVARITDSLKGSPELEEWVLASLLGEILLCLKDSKNKTRDAASHLLISVSRDVDVVVLIYAITAAVASETSHMRSAAVTALSKVVLEHGKSDERVLNLMPSLLQTVMLLSVDPSREVSKSMIVFLRVAISVCPPEMIQTLLPAILESLLAYHKGKDRFRGKLKITMKKLVRIFSVDYLMPLVADSDSYIVDYMKKLAKGEIKAKGSRKDQYREKSVEEMMASDEEDSDSEDSGAGAKLPADTSGRNLRDNRQRRVRHDAGGGICLSEGHVLIRNGDRAGFEVKDLTGTTYDIDDSDSDDDESIGFDERGRLVIKEKSNVDGQKQESFIGRATSSSKTRKRAHCDHEQRAKKLGDAYKSSKAGGDVRRKGQLFDPFVYLPLDGKNYTKKNRRFAVQQLDKVVGGQKRQKR